MRKIITDILYRLNGMFDYKIDRRKFIGYSSLMSAALFLFPKRLLAVVPDLNTNEEAIIEELTGVLIPSDDTPGAKDLSVINYINEVIGADDRYLSSYVAIAEKLDSLSMDMYGKPFLEAENNEKIQVVAALELNEPRLFNVAIKHTYEGFYSQKGSWNYIGYEHQPLPEGYEI